MVASVRMRTSQDLSSSAAVTLERKRGCILRFCVGVFAQENNLDREQSVDILTAVPWGHHFLLPLFGLRGQGTFYSVGHKARQWEERAALGTWLLSRLGKSQ